MTSSISFQTVIFDSCYSGSGTRGNDGTVRSAGLENHNIHPSLDSDIWGSENNPRGIQSAAATGLSSHVLLSACSADEVAREDGGKGRFTTALLKVFNKTSPDQLTYEQVMNRLDQIPRCVRVRLI